MTDIEIVRLGPEHALAFAGLLAEHAQERCGGSPPRPDRYHAEQLIADPRVGLIGARQGDELIGFAILHAITDCLTGRDAALLETVFVRSALRRHGAGRALLAAAGDEADRRAWTRLRRITDEAPTPANTFVGPLAAGRPRPLAFDRH